MVYDNIVKLCEKKKITIKQLEKLAEVGNGVIGKWKNGVAPRYETLLKLSKVLGVKPDTLMKE